MGISLDSLGMYTNGVTTSASDSATKKLENTLNNVNESSDAELLDACKSFEAYFIEQVFKSMEKTVMKDESSNTDSSGYSAYSKDMMMQKYAENAAEGGGFGIAQMLYESMKRQ